MTMNKNLYCFISCRTGQTDKAEVNTVTNIITTK